MQVDRVVVTSDETQASMADLVRLKSEETGEIGDICQRAIDVITNLSREKVVTGSIKGGVLDLEEVPEGVTVDTRDYDAEGAVEDLLEDKDGDSYFQAG